jgi:rRNA maturation RNase YbeY
LRINDLSLINIFHVIRVQFFDSPVSHSIIFSYRLANFRVRNSRTVKQWLSNAITLEKKKLQRLNIIFCTDKELLRINRNFLKHDYFTDIITFQYNRKNTPLEAEIFISVNRVINNAEEFETKIKDELHRVMIHGVLHLCGYKDKTVKEKSAIRLRENIYLQKRNF